MKRYKRLGVLCGALLVLCGATVAMLSYQQHQEAIENSGEAILQIPEDSVTALSWKNETTELSFHKEEQWMYDQDEKFPVDADKINSFLSEFSDFAASFVIKDVEDYSQYGLDEPICTIGLTADGADYAIALGDFSKMDDQRYASIGDGNVYLMQKDPLDNFSAELKDMICHNKIPSFTDTQGIAVTGTTNYTIRYEEDSKDSYCADDVYFAKIGDESLPLDTKRVKAYLKDMTNLDMTDYVTYCATDSEIKKYGLDAPDFTVSVDYTYKDDQKQEIADTFVMSVACDKSDDELTALLAKEKDASDADKDNDQEKDDVKAVGEEIVAYARVGESKIICQLTLDQYEKVVAMTYDDLRHLEVITADFAEVNQIDVSLDGKEYTITATGDEKDREYYLHDEKIDGKDWESAVVALKAEDFTDEKATGKEEISFTLHLDQKANAEIAVSFYQYDGEDCLTTIDGESVGLVPRALVVDAIESINAIVLN